MCPREGCMHPFQSDPCRSPLKWHVQYLPKADPMDTNSTDIIDKLRRDAIARCRERVLQVAKKREDQAKRPEPRTKEYGVTLGLKTRYGL